MTDLPDGFVVGAPQASAPPLPEGFVAGPAHPTAGPSGDFLTDLGRRVGTAGADVLAGTLSMPRSLAQGVDWLGRRVGVNVGADQALASVRDPTNPNAPAFPDYQTAREGAFATTGGTEYVPQTQAGRIAQGALTGGMGAILTGNPRMVVSGFGGGALGQTAADLFPNHPALAAMAGFAAGAHMTKGLLNAGASLAGVPIGGGTMAPEDAALAQKAQAANIPLGAADISNSRPLKFAASMSRSIPLNGNELPEQQQTAFNRAVSSTFGENAPRITQDVLQRARDRIGGTMNDIAGRNTIAADNEFYQDTADILKNAQGELTKDQLSPVATNLRNVLDKVKDGQISGTDYQALTRYDTPLGRAMRASDVGVRFYANQIRDALDSAMQRSVSPQDATALQQARTQWKAMKTVEPLTLRADTVGGATPSTGDISPAALRGAVNQNYPQSAYQENQLDTLARVGQRFLKEPPSSGTTERSLLSHGVGGMAGIGGILGGEHLGLPMEYSIPAAAVSVLANRYGLSPLLNNQALARAVINRSVNPEAFRFAAPSRVVPLAPALLGSGPSGPSGTPPTNQ